MNIGQECSVQHIATSECDKEHSILDTYKHIAYEVFSRAKRGDITAFEILKTVFDESKKMEGVV